MSNDDDAQRSRQQGISVGLIPRQAFPPQAPDVIPKRSHDRRRSYFGHVAFHSILSIGVALASIVGAYFAATRPIPVGIGLAFRLGTLAMIVIGLIGVARAIWVGLTSNERNRGGGNVPMLRNSRGRRGRRTE